MANTHGKRQIHGLAKLRFPDRPARACLRSGHRPPGRCGGHAIQRMKELLFGMKEKKQGKDEAQNRAEDGRPGADGSSQTDSPNEPRG